MKKQLSSFAVMFFVSACVLIVGNSSASAQMTVGGRVGLDIGSLSFSPDLPSGETSSSHTGFLVGGQLDDWFSDMWALSVQLLYNQKGASLNYNESFDGISVSGSGSEVLSYLEIPILAKVAFGSGDVKPYLFAGPSIGILLSATGSSTANGTSTSTSDDSDFNTLDLSALVGAGVSYKLAGGPSLFVDAGYAIGLINIAKNNSSSTSTSMTNKTNDIRIAAGVMFPLD